VRGPVPCPGLFAADPLHRLPLTSHGSLGVQMGRGPRRMSTPHPPWSWGSQRGNLPSCATCWPSAIAQPLTLLAIPPARTWPIHAPARLAGAERIGPLDGCEATSWSRTEHQPPWWLPPCPRPRYWSVLEKRNSRGSAGLRRLFFPVSVMAMAGPDGVGCGRSPA